MIVCHCTVTNDEVIRTHIAQASDTVDDIGRACGAGAHCGGCRETIQDVLKQFREAI